MRFRYVIFLLGLLFIYKSFGADPYRKAYGKYAYSLKSTLKKITKKNHHSRDYYDLSLAFFQIDKDEEYETDHSLIDIYSENPFGADDYNYTHFNQRCGEYSQEGQCFNREHIFPQSSFNKDYPMKSDIFHVYPTDGFVNGRRGELPFGEVQKIHWQSKNGSKIGTGVNGDFRGRVFEPIDEFKGDIARSLFYFATRYEDQIKNFEHKMLDGSRKRVYKKWVIDVLLRWHKNDPVSSYERRRNNAGEKFQGNRNPFIDHPEWVELIWD
ncbi:MAG: endonuclease [Bacteriovoracaceae bacterium]|nr:endonuclease I [Halobacteriovoraceae bacterium]MDP7321190.1 endonuclease [Bacteriovoracaceae bacterium]